MGVCVLVMRIIQQIYKNDVKECTQHKENFEEFSIEMKILKKFKKFSIK